MEALHMFIKLLPMLNKLLVDKACINSECIACFSK